MSAPNVCPARTPGPLGLLDQADPNVSNVVGDTPGPVGMNDGGTPPACYPDPLYSEAERVCYGPLPPPNDEEDWNPVASGMTPVSIGIGAVLRIPIPGSGGLFIELSPRGYSGESTSSVFIQDATGRCRNSWRGNVNARAWLGA